MIREDTRAVRARRASGWGKSLSGGLVGFFLLLEQFGAVHYAGFRVMGVEVAFRTRTWCGRCLIFDFIFSFGLGRGAFLRFEAKFRFSHFFSEYRHCWRLARSLAELRSDR